MGKKSGTASRPKHFYGDPRENDTLERARPEERIAYALERIATALELANEQACRFEERAAKEREAQTSRFLEAYTRGMAEHEHNADERYLDGVKRFRLPAEPK